MIEANLFRHDFKEHVTDLITERHILYKSNYAKNFKNGQDANDLFENYVDYRPASEQDEHLPFLETENKKLIICFKVGIWHTWGESFAIALEWLRNNPEGIIVFLIANKFEENGYSKHAFESFLNYLKSIGSDAFILDDTVDKISIKNFQFFKTYRRKIGFHILKNLDQIRNFYGSHSDPFRKVYVSRSKTLHKGTDFTTGTNLKDIIYFNRFDDQRCDEEYLLEEYLQQLNFEIVYAEDFEKMEDQIKFFSEVRTLISITNSGISNMLWTRGNAKIIEITIPLLVNKHEMLEHQWFELAYVLQKTYASIPSFAGNARDVINKIESTPGLKQFISE